MKFADLMMLRDRLVKSETMLSAVRMLLKPPVVNPVTQVTAVLNKMTSSNYAKLSPIVLDMQSEDVARDVMKAAIQQATFNRVYIDLLKSMDRNLITIPFSEFVATTHDNIATIDTYLAELSATEDYDDFCDSLKRKTQFVARVNFLVLAVRNNLIPRDDIKTLCANMGEAIRIAKHDLGIETFLESLCACAQYDDDILQLLTSVCKDLTETRHDLSFKVKFKCEKAVDDVVSASCCKKAQ